MKAFWDKLGRGLAKAALWCASHPDVIKKVIETAKH